MKRIKTRPELSVEMKRAERELTLQGEPVLRWELTWPECSGTWRGLRAVTAYYRRYAEAWRERWGRELYSRACLDLAERQAQGKGFRPWRAGLTTQITWQEDGVLSLWQEAVEHWGYDRPLILRTGDTWSLEEGAPRTLASFFPGQRRWKQRLLTQVEEQARKRLAGGESLLDPDCLARLEQAFDAGRFYRTRDGVEVFYPLYVLAPGAEGIPAFTVPLPER